MIFAGGMLFLSRVRREMSASPTEGSALARHKNYSSVGFAATCLAAARSPLGSNSPKGLLFTPSRPLRYLTREGTRATTQGRPYDTVKAVPRHRNMRKENAVFPRQRAGRALPFLSAAVFCVVPTVNFAQQNLKTKAAVRRRFSRGAKQRAVMALSTA